MMFGYENQSGRKIAMLNNEINRFSKINSQHSKRISKVNANGQLFHVMVADRLRGAIVNQSISRARDGFI